MSSTTIPAGTIPARPMIRAQVPRLFGFCSPNRFRFNGSKSSLLAPKKKEKKNILPLLLASSLLILTSWSADFQLKSFRIYSRAIEITSRRSFSMIYCSSKYSCQVVKIGGTVHGTVDYICELFQIFQRVFSWSLPPDTDPGPCPSAAAAFVKLQVMTAPCFSKFHHEIVKMCYHDNSIVDYICEFFEIF